MRLMKDTTFEERMRRQLYNNIKEGIKANLDKKDLWDSNTNQLKDTGTRGAIFIYDNEELTSLFNVNFDKNGIEGFIVPDLKNLH
eukprot:5873839-Heterocapsa_arctica.AAC.1